MAVGGMEALTQSWTMDWIGSGFEETVNWIGSDDCNPLFFFHLYIFYINN